MLKLQAVSMSYGATGAGSATVTALDRVELDVADGEFVAIIGPSGCGKTSLLEVIGGFRTPTRGEVLIDGSRIDGPHADIGVVFQEDSTFPWLTVEQNIEFSLRHRSVPRSQHRAIVKQMIGLVGLEGFERHRPAQLSGGMKQRVALARALAPRPKLLLMDEPFGALDEQSRLALGDELLRIWRTTGCTIIFITHSLSEAAMLADRVVVMTARPGRVHDVIDSPAGKDRSSDVIGSPGFAQMTATLWKQLRSGRTAAAPA